MDAVPQAAAPPGEYEVALEVLTGERLPAAKADFRARIVRAAKAARPFSGQELALWSAAVIVLGAVLGQVIGAGHDATPVPLPPAPPTAAPGAANLSAVDTAPGSPTVVNDPAPAEAVAPLPPPTRTDPALAAAPAPAKAPVAAASGQLKLAVSPWGEVYVNGSRRGVTPPLRVLELPPGTYRIEIRNAGLPPRIQRVTIASGKSTSIRHRFQ